jgi:hypothetical protein
MQWIAQSEVTDKLNVLQSVPWQYPTLNLGLTPKAL